MIRLQAQSLSSVDDARSMLQTAIGVEFGTLPPYLYALMSIRPGTNGAAAQRIRSVALQEMIHMCLACNILNAIGGAPVLTPPVYPGPLPGDIGPPGGKPLIINLLRFSEAAMKQGMDIEEPEEKPEFPVKAMVTTAKAAATVTIGQFYDALDRYLSTLPEGAWTPQRNQITDAQFFAGQLFAINGYADAHRAIREIVSEGEGTKKDPLDFQHDIAHYYRFGECFYNKVLTKAKTKLGYQWGPVPLGVDWQQVYPAIDNPASHDFSKEPPAAQQAQTACNEAFTSMVDALRLAMNGNETQLGVAVRAMFDLGMAAQTAFNTPLNDGQVAGPAFLCLTTTGASS